MALDAGPLAYGGPGARYVRELADALNRRGIGTVPYAAGLRARSLAAARWPVPRGVVHAAWRGLGWPPIERLTGPVDVVHATGCILPAARAAAGVVTLHDPAILSRRAAATPRLGDLVEWSLRRARRVLVPTHAARDAVWTLLDVPQERVIVSPEGVSPEFFGASPLAEATLAAMGVREPFVLVGVEGTKRDLEPLLGAWSKARRQLPEWSLVIMEPHKRLRAPEMPPGVVVTGGVADETLPGLLAAAAVFCYPWVYESFGSAAVAAMAAGTPVIAGECAASRDVLKDGAVLVEARDVESISETLVGLATDVSWRRSLTGAGRARSALYTWDGAARSAAGAYESALKA